MQTEFIVTKVTG